jgi:hypothetical protein
MEDKRHEENKRQRLRCKYRKEERRKEIHNGVSEKNNDRNNHRERQVNRTGPTYATDSVAHFPGVKAGRS